MNNMNTEGVKLTINERFDSFITEFYLMGEHNGRRTFYFIEDGIVKQHLITVEEEYKVGIIKPFLSVPMSMAKLLMNQFVIAASEQNIVTPDENLMKGKMDAMGSHLLDMQIIVKKLMKIETSTNET